MKRFGEGYERFIYVTGMLAGVNVGILALIVTYEVTIRYLGFRSLLWLIEVAEYNLFITTLLGAPWVLRLGAHVRVDVLLTILPARLRHRLEYLLDAMGVVICVVFAYFSFLAFLDVFRSGDLILTKYLILPEWMFLAVIPYSATLLAIEFARRIVRRARGQSTAGTGHARDAGI